MKSQRNMIREIVKIAGQEELGYNLLGCYMRPSDYKYETLGARYRYCAVLLLPPYIPKYAEDVIDFDNSKQRLEKTKQKLREIKRYLNTNQKVIGKILGENSTINSLGYIASAPFRDAMLYNYKIEKKHGVEGFYYVPENVKKELITFEDAILRNPLKYSKIEKMLYDLTNTNKNQLIENLVNTPLNRLTIESLAGGTFLSPFKRLTCQHAINKFQEIARNEDVAEVKYDKKLNTIRLAKKGVDYVINQAKKMGFVRENNGNISLTMKGLAFVNEYFEYVGSGG